MFYPKWKYHRSLDAAVVHDEADELSLGPDWHDTPAAFDVEASEGEAEELNLEDAVVVHDGSEDASLGIEAEEKPKRRRK